MKTFDHDRGFGFVECAETYTQSGSDVFILKSQVTGSLRVGDKVSFTVEKGTKGFKCAEVRVADNYQAPRGPGSVYYGSVKRFDHDKGFGFIECPDLYRSTGKDVLLLRSHLEGLEIDVGDKLSFVTEQTDKGLKAVNIQRGHGPPPSHPSGPTSYGAPPTGQYGGPPAYGASSTGFYGGPPPQYPGGPPPYGGGPPPAGSGPPPADPDQKFTGSLKAFDDDKGFGFIACNETRKIYNKDIFVLKSQFQGEHVQNGDQVRFSIKISDKGPACADVTLLREGNSNGGYRRSDSEPRRSRSRSR